MCKYSENCTYSDDDAMLYCVLKLDEHELLLSAREVQVFDQYLALAHDKDKDVTLDTETADQEPYYLVYGGIMFHERKFEEVAELVEQLKGFALLDLDREIGKLAVSGYEDIVLYPELAKWDGFIPFAALMQTTHPFDNLYESVTMFPLMGDGCVWEHMANKPFLLACRRKVELDANVTVENWKYYIDIDQLEEAYGVADLYTGPLDDGIE